MSSICNTNSETHNPLDREIEALCAEAGASEQGKRAIKTALDAIANFDTKKEIVQLTRRQVSACPNGGLPVEDMIHQLAAMDPQQRHKFQFNELLVLITIRRGWSQFGRKLV